MRLRWSSPFGAEGLDSDPHNPFARSIDRVIQTGKPIEKLALTFIRDATDPEDVRWFGTFVRGRRIMFFPGFEKAYDGILAAHDNTSITKNQFQLDHVSLEANLAKWHVTTAGSTDHYGSPRTHDLGQGRRLWFGLSTATQKEYKRLYRDTEATFTTPTSDTERRREIIRSARENQEFPLLTAPSALLQNSPSFMHVTVIAGPAGFDYYLGDHLRIPFDSPYLVSDVPKEILGLQSMIFRIGLGDVDLQVTVAKVPGRMKSGVLFTG